MSKQRFKITLHYDTNCGYIDEKVIYCEENNTVDYRTFYNADGSDLEFDGGTDSYCKYLGYALQLEDYVEEYNNMWLGCKINKLYEQ